MITKLWQVNQDYNINIAANEKRRNRVILIIYFWLRWLYKWVSNSSYPLETRSHVWLLSPYSDIFTCRGDITILKLPSYVSEVRGSQNWYEIVLRYSILSIFCRISSLGSTIWMILFSSNIFSTYFFWKNDYYLTPVSEVS